MNILVNTSERLLKSTLEKWGHDVVTVNTGEDAITLLQRQGSPNLVILQTEMHGCSGLEVCRRIRDGSIEPYKYFILLTADIDVQKDDLLEAFEYGADDYLIKPFDGYELRAKLLVAKRILDLQDRLVGMREELRAQASHDALTGIWNRRAMMESLAAELDRARRDKTSVGVAIIDIDNFKCVNDTYGHQMGDEVLREVANILKASIRPYDLAGRFGGEEFMVILPGCFQNAIRERLETIRESVAAEVFATSEGTIHLTVSIGAATTTSRVTPAKIIKAADEALYRAKNAGRNCVEIAERFFSEVPATA